mgnify:FL=1
MKIMDRGRSALVAVGVLALVVGACGGDDDESGGDAGGDDASADQVEGSDPGDTDAPEASSDSAGTAGSGNVYSGELEDGSVLTVTFDVDETDPLVVPFVDFREQAGVADPVVWITASLEAPGDFDDVMGPPTGRFLTFVEPGGELISETNPTSTFACSRLDTWFGSPTGDEGAALNEQYISIVREQCDGQTLGVIGEAGSTTDYVMVFEGPSLPEFESVYAGLLSELEPV